MIEMYQRDRSRRCVRLQRRSGSIPVSMNQLSTTYTLGIDIGSTTVKVALLDQEYHIIFSDY